MALSSYERYFVYDTSLKLLQQDLLTNAYFMGSSTAASLRDMVLARQPVQPLTNPFDEAITGTLRADARTTMQNARNVKEAAKMMGVAFESTASIYSALGDMKDIIDMLDEDPDLYNDTVKADYNALRDQVKALVSNTDYNGIYILDGSKWGTEQIDSDGKVYIQAYGDGGFDLNFHDLDAINWDSLEADAGGDDDNLGEQAWRDSQETILDGFMNQMQSIRDIYESREASLEFQSARLASQSDLLEQAANARRTTPLQLNPEQILLNLILSATGSLVNEST
jgi:flagellin